MYAKSSGKGETKRLANLFSSNSTVEVGSGNYEDKGILGRGVASFWEFVFLLHASCFLSGEKESSPVREREERGYLSFRGTGGGGGDADSKKTSRPGAT